MSGFTRWLLIIIIYRARHCWYNHLKSSLVPHPQLKLVNKFSNLNSINITPTVKVSTDADFTALMVPDELGTELLIHLCDGGFQVRTKLCFSCSNILSLIYISRDYVIASFYFNCSRYSAGLFQMESITIDLNKSLYGHLLGSETITNLGNITKDPRFNEVRNDALMR